MKQTFDGAIVFLVEFLMVLLMSESKYKVVVYVRRTISCSMCAGVQKMCASSCWKRRTRVSPVSAPLSSLRCSTPKSASRSGSSRHERMRLSNSRLRDEAINFSDNNSVKGTAVVPLLSLSSSPIILIVR